MQERNQDRNNIIECLKMLGFNIFTLDRFFRFLWDQRKETEALIGSIEGGVNMSGCGTGPEHYFIQYDRREIRGMASMVASLMIPAKPWMEGEAIAGDLELILRPKIDLTLSNSKRGKIKSKLFRSLLYLFHEPRNFWRKGSPFKICQSH